MAAAAQADVIATRRLITREMLGACLAILILAQVFIGLLSLASFSRLATSTTTERIELAVLDVAGQIETGLRLGKPLVQYTGLARLLERAVQGQQDLVAASVTLPDGRVLARHGLGASVLSPALGRQVAAGDVAALTGATPLARGGAMLEVEGFIGVAVPLRGRGGKVAGALTYWVDNRAQQQQEREFVWHSAQALALTTVVAALLLVLVLTLAPPSEQGSRWRLALPLLVLLLAQALYATEVTRSFRSAWLESTRNNAELLAERTVRDLARVFAMNVAFERVRGVDAMFQRLAATLPTIGTIVLRTPEGQVLAAASAQGPLAPATLPARLGRESELHVERPIQIDKAGEARTVATLVMGLDAEVLAAGVRARVLDAGTVVVISAITAFELFLLVIVLVNRRLPEAAVPVPVSGRAEDVARLARPLMFGFLFAWALPLSFLPLYAATLAPGWLHLPENLMMALPISAEMLCGLCGALLAGRLTDRRGWRAAVVAGLLLAGLGAVASALVSLLEAFVLSRALVGLGYGLAWMGLQGLVVSRSSPVFRGRNMAWLVAGLFAGHLSGTAAGALLVDEFSYRPVFVASAVLVLAPLLGVFLLRGRRLAASSPVPLPQSGSPPVGVAGAVGLSRSPQRGLGLRHLLFSRDYGALLAGSIVPFSIAQVGLLYFALPLYLQALGVSLASIGRVLMLYGLCVIYLGPPIGRFVDRQPGKRRFIALGGVLGSAGLIYLQFDHSLFAVSLAVLLLALGSCWCAAAQTSWMLSLPHVQAYGPAGATSIMRAADKFGQMVGPLFVGGLFTLIGIDAGLAMTGLFYLLATLAFVVVSARARPVTDSRPQ